MVQKDRPRAVVMMLAAFLAALGLYDWVEAAYDAWVPSRDVLEIGLAAIGVLVAWLAFSAKKKRPRAS